MTTPVIQELTIDARGATAGSALYVKAMSTAQAAVDRLMDRERLLQQQAAKGVPVTEQVSQSTSRLAAAYDKLRGSVDPALRVQIAHQRELEKAMLTTDAAVRRGLSTQQESAKIISQIRARQLAEVNALTTAEQRHTTAVMNAAAANDNRSSQSFNTGNIAAQFQDIGVTAAMGMSPLQIALQQGTQLSAVLGGQGLTGVVKSLGAAFMSVISPVSLLTIGVVALVAAGIQGFMSLVKGADATTEALKRNEEWLDRVLQGYGDVARAADAAAEHAGRLPQGAAEAGAGISYTTAQTAYLQKLREAAASQADLNTKVVEWNRLRDESALRFQDDLERLARFDTLTAFGKELTDVEIGVQSTTAEINAFVSSAYKLKAVAADPATQKLAQDMINVGDAILAARAQAEAAWEALTSLQALSPINIAVNVGLKGVDDALAKLKEMTPDLRTAREIARDTLNEGLSSTGAVPGAGPGLRNQLYATYEATVAALDLQDAQREAEKTAAESGRTANRLADAYKNVVSSANQRIAQAQLETQLVGMTTEAAGRLRAEHELLAQAEQSGVVVDAKKRAELIGLADKLWAAEERTRSLTRAEDERAARAKQTTDVLTNAAMQLLKPWKDLDDIVASVMGQFAQLGESNVRSVISNFLNSTGSAPANDNGGWGNVWDKVGTAVRDGAKDGTSGGLTDFLKSNSGTIGAGLGGLGVGYQTQNPLMGAIGGALGGASAGPWGAVIGGLAGLVGGILGMREALEKAKKAVNDNQSAIDEFIATGLGEEIDQDAMALARFKAQGQQLVDLAKAAGDSKLVAQIERAMNAYKSTLAADRVRDDFDKAKDDLLDAYRSQADALEEVVDRTRDFISTTEQFRDSLALDKQFSPLNPERMLEESRKQFDLLLSKAQLGDANAQGRLQGAATSYLDAARGYYGSSDQYQDVFARVDQALVGVVGAAGTQLSNTERQLEATNRSIAALTDINNSILTIPEAIQQLERVTAAAAQLQGEAAEKLLAEIEALNKKLGVNDLKKKVA